jgi:hypothetical protein
MYALYILAYPPYHRKLAMVVLSLPVIHAFRHMLDLTPCSTINDTFGRFLYIWLAHMSHELCILEFTPVIDKENDTWKERVKQAYKVLFARHPTSRLSSPSYSNKRRRSPQTHTRLTFCLHHAHKAALCTATKHIWTTYIDPPSSYTPSSFHPSHASFIRRLPTSLNTNELRTRFMMKFELSIGDMLFFESLHSLFAILFVGILRLDGAEEWSTALFGGIGEAWSVRRYWGRYWHDYVYESFAAHVKVLVRGWGGMQRGKGRRVLENGLVFVVSGLMHGLVRGVQTGWEADVWAVVGWYAAQMVPLVVEGMVQDLWSGLDVRVRFQRGMGSERVIWLERAVGYTWVFAWMFWSVPKFLHTRSAWDAAIWRKRYPEYFVGSDASMS